MRSRLFPVLVAVVTLLSIAPPVQAGPLNAVARWLGVGWSDGYHSQTTCPPKHGMWMATPEPASVPWWTIPAQPVETLPHPAAQRPENSRSTSPPNPSIFRQPAERPVTTASAAGGY